MKNLKALSDGELHLETDGLVKEERRVGTEILHRLRENERRRLYASMGYSSLFQYCVEALKYSESAAFRRISAMRLLAEIPEVEGAIQEGRLSLSTACQAQSFFLAQKKQGAVLPKREIL